MYEDREIERGGSGETAKIRRREAYLRIFPEIRENKQTPRHKIGISVLTHSHAAYSHNARNHGELKRPRENGRRVTKPVE